MKRRSHLKLSTKSRPAVADIVTDVVCYLVPGYCDDQCIGDGRTSLFGYCLIGDTKSKEG